MRLILLGPPGSGKGTQSKRLSRQYRLTHISTGDLIRSAIRSLSPVGQRVRPLVETGCLVPDEVVNDLVAELFGRDDRPTAFVMDGYPRTLAQAQAFDTLLVRYRLPLTAVVRLQVGDEEILHRLGGRWTCPTPDCKAVFHIVSNPPRVPGICDDCGQPLVQRDDDKVETVRTRLQVYHQDTAGLIPYYRVRGLLRETPGHGEIEQVYNGVQKALS